MSAAELKCVLEPFRGMRATIPGVLALAPVSYYLGVLNRVLGRLDEAERWLRDAVRRTSRSPHPSHPGPWALAGLSAVLLQNGNETMVAEATQAATMAEHQARAAGSNAVLERLRALAAPEVGSSS